MKITLNNFVALFFALTVLMSSCQKDKQENSVSSEKGTVTLKIGGASFADFQSSGTTKASSNKKAVNTASDVQTQEISFNDEFNVIATLKPVSKNLRSIAKASTRAESVSNGILTEPLERGVIYTVSVYEKDNKDKKVASKNFTHYGNEVVEFDLAPGEYTVVVFGINSMRYSPQTKYRTNYLHRKENITVVPGKNTNLNLTLTNMFAEITVSLNTGTVGMIESIDKGTLDPIYTANFGVNLDEFEGTVTYGKYLGSNEFSFPAQPVSALWKSGPIPMQVKSTDKGEVILHGVKINGIKGNIHLSNLMFEEGVKYELELSLGKKTEKTFKIGNLEFAMGNLYYEEGNNSYYFQSHGDGSYFFPSFVKPKKFGVSNNEGNSKINGSTGDPCKLVKPLNTWRLPTETEIKTLLTQLNITPKNNPIESPFDPQVYNTENATIYSTEKGVAFGTKINLGNDPSDYLFLYYSGFYDFSDTKSTSKRGFYLISSTTAGYTQLQLHENAMAIPPYASIGAAISVRCVKN
ncbi:hypothetical protein [Sphingobacterium athyrii]|nr:hypothetical protein [Sphingobacterium athyrii]